jgi:hypothetical protein
LTILSFFFPLVRGLSSQYLNIFPQGLSEGILSWTFICWPPSLLPYFPFLPSGQLCSVYQELNLPPPFALEVSCTLILLHFVHLWPYPSWELEAPLGSHGSV